MKALPQNVSSIPFCMISRGAQLLEKCPPPFSRNLKVQIYDCGDLYLFKNHGIDLKWLHMVRYELISRLDGALWLRMISGPPDPQMAHTNQQSAQTPQNGPWALLLSKLGRLGMYVPQFEACDLPVLDSVDGEACKAKKLTIQQVYLFGHQGWIAARTACWPEKEPRPWLVWHGL